ncbi:MAG: helix-turn-helix transcriptional regulator, GntR family [Microbacteriaceae bacterium]|nr:helix-turn-helix transcriptional regulator, GntR family [Microbacteriaceae bacterium]
MYTFAMALNTFYDDSYVMLRQQILDGTLKPGTRLDQKEIAEQFGLSRVPLREAIRKLEGERLVTVVPRKGVTVPDLTDDDIRDLYIIRIELEPLAFRRATEAITDDQVAELTDMTVALEGLLDQPDKFFHAHDDIVRTTMAASPGRMFLDIVTMVRERSQHLRYSYSQFPGQTDWLLEHRRAVLRAIASRRADLVEQITRLDLIEGRDALLQWRANGSPRPDTTASAK